MRTQVTFLAALATLVGLSLLWPTPTVQAEDAVKGTPVWVYEVRVVRVDPSEAAASESGSPFRELERTTIDLPWTTVLARLKERGTTRVLMDTRVTAMDGIKTETREEASTPIVALNFEDWNNQQYRSQVIKQGCSFQQTTSNMLQYQVQVRGAVTPPSSKRPPTQYVVDWNGTHPLLKGRTLVLEHRQQVAVPPPGRAAPHSGRVAKLRAALQEHQEKYLEAQEGWSSARARVIPARRAWVLAKGKREEAEMKRRFDEAAKAAQASIDAEAQWQARQQQLQDQLAAARTAPKGGGQAQTRAIEHYAFITGRLVAGS